MSGKGHTYDWGDGYITFKPPNTWQATCGRRFGSHRNLAKPGSYCRQTRAFRTDTHKTSSKLLNSEATQLALKHWLNGCRYCRSRTDHQKWRPELHDLPSKDKIESQKLPDGWVSDDDPDCVRMEFKSKGVLRQRRKLESPAKKLKCGGASSKSSSSSSSSTTSTSE